jgi:hypothetical protein
MEQKVNEDDFNFLARVDGLQKALINSCTSPVVVWKTEEGGYGLPNFAMYYDCTNDENIGYKIMEKRTDLAEQDIVKHFRLHKSALEYFLNLDNAIVDNNRKEFSEIFYKLYKDTKKSIDLIEAHKISHKDESFLDYPSCPPGHYFHIWKGEFISRVNFNPQRTKQGALRALEKIQQQSTDFKIRQEKLPYIAMPFSEDGGAGLFDSSFRQNLSITQQLLEKLGLRFD